MEQKEIKEIVQEYRQKGFGISDQEAEKILLFSERKIGMMNLPDPEQYLELLFQDELKNYIYRNIVNAISLQRIVEKWCGKCVACVL
jgi:hypothetical protein